MKRFFPGQVPVQSSLCVLTTAAFFTWISPGFAQAPGEEAPQADTENEEIEIVASPPISRTRASGSSGAVTTIDVREFDGRYASLDELLERESGVRVQRYGGQGAYAVLSIRGSTPNQVQIYVDGIPLNNAVSGEVNLADLNLQGIESIEIYRSGNFPGTPIGGAVNFVTRKKRRSETGAELSAFGGSFRTFGAGGTVWGGEGLRYDVSVRGEKSGQDFRFRSDNGTPVLNKSDDFDDLRSNAQYESVFSTVNLGWQLWDTDFTLLNDSTYRLHGIPGPGSAQTQKARRKLIRNTTGLAADAKGFLFEALRLQSRAFYTGYWIDFFDPEQEFSFRSPDQESRLQHYGVHLEPSLYLLDYAQILRFYFAAERESYHADRRNRFHELIERLPGRFRDHHTARVADEFLFFNERLQITPSAEYQRYTNRFNSEENNRLNEGDDSGRAVTDFTNYRLGALVIPWRDRQRRFFLKASAYSGKRMPLFIELFGEAGAIIGNTDLLPESSETVEGGAGVEWKGDSWSGQVELNVFRRTVDDLILFVPNSQFTLRPENVDRADIRGGEFSSRMRAFDHLKAYFNYTYQRAINRSDVSFLRGRYLALQPLHELHTGLALHNNSVEGGVEAIYVGAVYRDRSNEPQNYQAPRWIYSVYFRFALNGTMDGAERLLLGIDVKNVLDDRISDIVNYPLPGRSMYVSLNYRF